MSWRGDHPGAGAQDRGVETGPEALVCLGSRGDRRLASDRGTVHGAEGRAEREREVGGWELQAHAPLPSPAASTTGSSPYSSARGCRTRSFSASTKASGEWPSWPVPGPGLRVAGRAVPGREAPARPEVPPRAPRWAVTPGQAWWGPLLRTSVQGNQGGAETVATITPTFPTGVEHRGRYLFCGRGRTHLPNEGCVPPGKAVAAG